jgi:hypothetical protein
VTDVLGPKAKQLQQYVDSADEGALHAAGGQWSQGERLLRDLAKQLADRGQKFGTDERFSGQSADAASKAFQSSAKKMQDRADQMRQGSQAFYDAATGVENARKISNQVNAHAGDQPPTRPPDLKDAEAQSRYQTQNKQFWDNYAETETTASHAITALNENHTRQAAVFQSIHGEAPPPAAPGGGGGSNPVSTGTRPPVTHVPNSGPIHNSSDGDVVVGGDDTPGGGDTPAGGGNDGGDTTTLPEPGPGPGVDEPPVHTGVPAGPGGPATTPGPIAGSPTTPGGGSIGAIGGVGAAAGGALGGAAAAGLAGGLAGGLNGLVPVSGGRGGLSASGVRGIGSTARAGAGSVLGRGGAGATGRAGAGGTAGRSSGGSGRSSRSAGGSAAGRGSRGAAGSRGAGAGAGAGSGRGGKDKKRQSEERDLFDDGADWLDDEDAAPGLLD